VQPLWVPDVTRDTRVATGTLFRDTGMRGALVFPITSEAEGKPIGVLAFNSRQVREPDERLLKAILVIGSQIGQFLQRTRAEEEQRRFRVAMDASADLMLLIDRASMRYIDVNDAACRALGYTREELLAMGPQDIFSKSREELAQLYDRMFASELTAPTVEGVYRCKDGSQLLIEAHPRAVRSAAGDVVVSIARDITERKRAEQLLKLEHSVARYLADAENLQAGLKATVRAICETEGWDCGRYLLVDEAAGVLRLSEAWGIQSEGIERFLASSRTVSYGPGAGLAGSVWQSGQPLWVTDVGKDARTVIPDRAVASLDLRLVKDVQPDREFERLVAHIRKQSYYVTQNEPTAEERAKYPRIARVVKDVWNYPATHTSMDLPVSRAVVEVVEHATGHGIVQMPTLGGSVPMYIFDNLHLPVIGVPTVNYDNNQHSANENLRIGNLWSGIEIFAALLAELRW